VRVGRYVLDLYCTAEHCHRYKQFTAQTEAGALKQASERGWIVERDAEKCPDHSGRKPKPQAIKEGERMVTLEELGRKSWRG
jgi:hypothetical protein